GPRRLRGVRAAAPGGGRALGPRLPPPPDRPPSHRRAPSPPARGRTRPTVARRSRCRPVVLGVRQGRRALVRCRSGRAALVSSRTRPGQEEEADAFVEVPYSIFL